MGLLTVGGKEIVKKSTKKAANEEAVNLVKGSTGKVAGSKTSAANELNLEDFKPRQTYGKFGGKFEQESGAAEKAAMEGGPLSVRSGGRLAKAEDEAKGSNGALTRRTSLAETAAGVRSRGEKDMGMADVVEPARLSGKEGMSSGSRASGPSGGGKAAAIAGGIAGAGGLAAIALMDRNESKEPSKANKASESTPVSSSKTNASNASSGSLADAVRDMPEKKAKKTISDFEKAFAKARDDGEKTFSFKGAEFTTRLKNESVSSFNKKFESQEDFPKRLYESEENSSRYQAGESGALAKGGYVKAKPKEHNGNRTSHKMQYNSIDMGKFMKKAK